MSVRKWLGGAIAATFAGGLMLAGVNAAAADQTIRVDVQTTPVEVWASLIDLGFRGIESDGCDCLMVPVGTHLDTPGHVWTFTEYGLAMCQDFTTTGAECA